MSMVLRFSALLLVAGSPIAVAAAGPQGGGFLRLFGKTFSVEAPPIPPNTQLAPATLHSPHVPPPAPPHLPPTYSHDLASAGSTPASRSSPAPEYSQSGLSNGGMDSLSVKTSNGRWAGLPPHEQQLELKIATTATVVSKLRRKVKAGKKSPEELQAAQQRLHELRAQRPVRPGGMTSSRRKPDLAREEHKAWLAVAAANSRVRYKERQVREGKQGWVELSTARGIRNELKQRYRMGSSKEGQSSSARSWTESSPHAPPEP